MLMNKISPNKHTTAGAAVECDFPIGARLDREEEDELALGKRNTNK